ncbi:MAG: glycerophosphodiester phosphodiesterase [Burkholderiales bacterium]|nr:glycerophosphodiester phosphodiesterase [Burkholderiales bacterium]
MKPRFLHHQWIAPLTVVGAALCLAACATNPPSTAAWQTLDGQPPLVAAHRGASGYLPEETLEAYVKAVELGADYIELDLISTKDGVLIARHDPNLDTSTDVAKHPEFAARKRTMSVDGESQTGWFSSDFTLAEIKTLGAISTDAQRPQEFNGKYKVPTFQEVIDLAKRLSAQTGRTIGIYPETKNPSHFRLLGLPLEDKMLAALTAAGWTARSAPVILQSFEPGSLKYMRSKGSALRMVQLIDGDSVDLKTGAVTYDLPPDGKVMDINGDGKVNDADATTTEPTSLIVDAHKAGLFVHAFTFRNEGRRLAANYGGDPRKEYLQFYALGVDGVFTDFTDTALAGRAEYSQQAGRKK